MKKVILVGFVLLAAATYGQKKKDNTIIVHGFVTFSALRSALFDFGYTPINTDTTIISTNYKPQGYLGEVAYFIKRTDSTVVVKGTINARLAEFDFRGEPLENTGQKGTVYRVGFETMDKIAKSFGHPVSYLKQ